MAISGSTRVVALLGHPVAHSLSPRMQNAAFEARELDWVYVALDVPPERFAEAVVGLAAAGLAGANVTAPHKLAAAALCADADTESVNTLVFEEGRVVGSSTDAARAVGATVVDGLEVLVRQGAASFERWTGVPAPVDAMRNAVRSAQ